MIVFTKLNLKERINLCLFCQSLADLVYMVENFLLYADRVYIEIMGAARRGPLFKLLLDNHLNGFYGFNSASGFMTTVIACERCFCVVSPLKSQSILKTKSMLVIIVVAFIVIVGVFFVVCTRWSIKCVFDPRTNTSMPEIYPGQFYLLNKQLIDTLDGYVYGIILPVSFIFLVSISTIITVVHLRKMASWREQSSTATAGSAAMMVRDVALTRMLIGCSMLFIVCNIPVVVFRALIVFVPEVSLGGRYQNMFTFMVSVTELFGYINSSCNFFIYYSMGTKYKQALNALCLCCRRRDGTKPRSTVQA
ncbi:probable G-protein coupled receptor frpr-1 [Littorina saxatilis]|uniref:probable G-protein coupled receptor frpr-1 n=1 Tax=Littorina saxatilis TaxID=31220 RepID=UPI0038B5F430